jgi:hypothetical protein
VIASASKRYVSNGPPIDLERRSISLVAPNSLGLGWEANRLLVTILHFRI